jgi:large conductance mechanosensitive channel
VLKGFKDFLMRGNIIDLAVAVVVGSAFTAVVTAFTNSIIKPLIALVGSGGVGSSGMVISLGDPGNDLTNIHLEVAINAVITFLITAAVVYFLFVLPMQKIQERRNKGKASEPTDNELLTEIRDLLRQQQGLSSLSSSTTSGDGDSQKTVTTSSSNGSNGSANNGGATDGAATNGEKN